MTDKNSPIIDFYPEKFETDFNGKKYDYESVVLLPLINEERLLKALKKLESSLTEDEKKRNSIASDLLLIEGNFIIVLLVPKYF
jgi:5'-3' exonuclease